MNAQFRTVTLSFIALMIWFGLILQFTISIPSYVATGRSVADAVLQIISFFTIQTNLLVALASTAIVIAPRSSAGKFFGRTSVLTALTMYILIVGLVYAVALKHIWDPKGWFKVADMLLHEVSPLAFLLCWLVFVPKEKLQWCLLFNWALFPLLYLVYSLIHGALTGDHPYPFLNVTKLGYGQVLINSSVILLAFVVVGSLLIGLSRLFANRQLHK